MPFARRWMRDMVGASAATLLVPGGIVAALIAAALGSGLGGLGSIGQLVGGPALPATVQTAAPAKAHHVARLPVVPVPSGAAIAPARLAPAATVVHRSAGAGHGGGGATGGGQGGRLGAARPSSGHANAPAAASGHGPAASTSPASSGQGTSPNRPAPSPGPVHQLAAPVEKTVASAPAPAGPAAADAVGSVVNLVEPDHSAGRTSGDTPSVSSAARGAAQDVTSLAGTATGANAPAAASGAAGGSG